MTLQHWADDGSYRDLDDLSFNVEPDERVGAPPPDRRKAGFRKFFLTMVLIGGAAAVVSHVGLEAVVASAKSAYEVVAANTADIIARAKERMPEAPPAPAPQIQEAAAPAILPELTPAPEPEAANAEPSPTAEAMGTAYAETPKPEEMVPDDTPKRKTAIKAGLSPDLPNVLLTRLSESDLKNAAYAIKTALAKTPDDKSFAWPSKPSQTQALFEVRFVPGAAGGCRRYIVTVTKDRWTSTSSAIEKCTTPATHDG